MEKMTTEKKVEIINKALEKSLLCIPPYPMITYNKVSELYRIITNTSKNNQEATQKLAQEIKSMVSCPWQRAYQIEYRFKKADIFTPFIPVLEYSIYDFFIGNYTSAYITLLPMVESVFREWGKKEPKLIQKTSMSKYYEQVEKYLKAQKFYADDENDTIDRRYISDFGIKYIVNQLKSLFESFGSGRDLNVKKWFNRNVVLHTLHDTDQYTEMRDNTIRLLLLLDMIVEIYLMEDNLMNETITLDADYETNIDFNLRWEIYINLAASRMYVRTLDVIQDSFTEETHFFDKQELLAKIKFCNQVIFNRKNIY